MHFTSSLLLAIIGGYYAALAAVAAPSVDLQHTVYTNVTRTLGNHSITLAAPCQSAFTSCARWCNNVLQEGDTLKKDCDNDCEDDYCDFRVGIVKDVEYPPSSGKMIPFQAFADSANEEKVAHYHSLAALRSDASACLNTCKTMYDAARHTGRPTPQGIAAQAAAVLLCIGVCSIFG